MSNSAIHERVRIIGLQWYCYTSLTQLVYISHSGSMLYHSGKVVDQYEREQVSEFVLKVLPHIAIASAMAPDRRCPSISLPAFCLTPHHQHVNIRHSDTEISRICTECRGPAVTEEVWCFQGIYAVLYSNCLRRSDIKRRFHVDRQHHVRDHPQFSHHITAAVVRVPCITVEHPSFQ